MLIAAGLVWLAVISTDGFWNPFLLGFMFLFFCFLFIRVHFIEREVAFSTKFWDSHPKLEILFIGLGSLLAFSSAYEAWSGVRLMPVGRGSWAVLLVNLIGKISATLIFIAIGLSVLYLCYLLSKRKPI